MPAPRPQSALLNFKAFLIVVLLFICTATFLRRQRPSMFPPMARDTPREQRPRGLMGLLYKASVIGTRLSHFVSLSCMLMAVTVLFF